MAHINRKYIDKHWLVFILRGAIALLFGWIALFNGNLNDMRLVIAFVSVFLLFMGIIDSASALYSSTKKHGWVNSVFDAGIDIIAALVLLFLSNNDLVFQLVTISIYTCLSGIVDIVHGFLSTVDPTDRFIRILTGICGCIMSFVILNAGEFEIATFIRFFGAYMSIVGVTSLIYGVHNKAQKTEDKTARVEAAKKRVARSKKSR